jgi:hypothetical protein
MAPLILRKERLEGLWVPVGYGLVSYHYSKSIYDIVYTAAPVTTRQRSLTTEGPICLNERHGYPD